MKEFRLRLPASSANLGPAFDAAALGIELFLEVRARPAARFSVTASGRDAVVCGRLKDNLLVGVYMDMMAAQGRPLVPLALRLANEIPIGKGCGSSAAARLAGVALAGYFGGLGWDGDRIVAAAARLEGHPDNVAAAWWGGLVVARQTAAGAVMCLRVAAARRWPLLLLVPPGRSATVAARAVLPAQYPRAAVVANLQNAMLLGAAWSQGRADLLGAAMEDAIHQPYRAQRCPLLPLAQSLRGQHGITGVALSGAGPAVLLVLQAPRWKHAAIAAITLALRKARLRAEIVATRSS